MQLGVCTARGMLGSARFAASCSLICAKLAASAVCLQCWRCPKVPRREADAVVAEPRAATTVANGTLALSAVDARRGHVARLADTEHVQVHAGQVGGAAARTPDPVGCRGDVQHEVTWQPVHEAAQTLVRSIPVA